MPQEKENDNLEISILPSNCISLNSLEFPGYFDEVEEEEQEQEKVARPLLTAASESLFGEQFRRHLNGGNYAGLSGGLEAAVKNERRDAILPMLSKNAKKQRGLIELRKAFNLEPYELDLYPNHCLNGETEAEGNNEERERVGEHPITGNTVPTFNLLIKVKRKARKTASGEMEVDREEEKFEFEASLVGLVNKTCRFRSLADFQVEMPQTDDVANLLADMKSLDSMLLILDCLALIRYLNTLHVVDKLQQFHFKPNADIPATVSIVHPSPSSCRLDIPSDYGFKENPFLSTVVKKDPKTGKYLFMR